MQEKISTQPWVTHVELGDKDGEIDLTVSVNDQQAAEAKLARLILSEELVSMIEFKRKTYDLEEVFLETVEGANHGRK